MGVGGGRTFYLLVLFCLSHKSSALDNLATAPTNYLKLNSTCYDVLTSDGAKMMQF